MISFGMAERREKVISERKSWVFRNRIAPFAARR
jgi:hypothetical protein